MILRRIFSISICILSLALMSFSIPDRLKKKVHKEIVRTFDVKDFTLSSISVNDTINQQLTHHIDENNLFKIDKNGELIGYAFLDKAPSKTDEFDYLILLDKDLIIAKTKVLVYREDYGGEIGSKRWLKQFVGKKAADTVRYERDIMAISGATISANSMTVAINQFLQNLDILHKNNVL